jgi:hypothetical protein
LNSQSQQLKHSIISIITLHYITLLLLQVAEFQCDKIRAEKESKKVR